MSDTTRNDNRSYVFRSEKFSVRPEYSVIAEWIPSGSSILDLGSGDGALLKYLGETNQTTGEGIERSASGVEKSLRYGISAKQGEIDSAVTYRDYTSGQFDFAICNVTLQMVMYPEVLITEMARVSTRQIISFPHFGHIFNRFDLLFTGRMPRPQLFGYQWHETGHVHQLGIADFLYICKSHALTILQENHMGRPAILSRFLPSLFSRTAVYLTQSQS